MEVSRGIRSLLAYAGRGNRREGKVGGRAAACGAPVIKKPPIAERDQFGGIEAQAVAGRVNPLSRALKLGEEANRRLIDYAMAAGISIFCPPLLVGEGRTVSELAEDDRHRIAIGDLGFCFDAVLVARRRIVVVGKALVGYNPALSVLADAENRLFRAQAPVRCVEEDVFLKSARRDLVKSKGDKLALQCGAIGDAEFHLDLVGAHGNSIGHTPDIQGAAC